MPVRIIRLKGRSEWLRVENNMCIIYLQQGVTKFIVPQRDNIAYQPQFLYNRLYNVNFKNYSKEEMDIISIEQAKEDLDEFLDVYQIIEQQQDFIEYPLKKNIKEILIEEQLRMAIILILNKYKTSFIKKYLNIKQKIISQAHRFIREKRQVFSYSRGVDKKLGQEEIQYFESILRIDENKFQSSKILRQQIAEKFNQEESFLSLQSIRNYLHNDLNKRWKKIQSYKKCLNSARIKEDRIIFARIIISLLQQGKHICWIDETGVNMEQYQQKAWIDKGKQFYYKKQDKSDNYTIICSISLWQVDGYIIMKKGAKWEYFLYFLNQLHENNLQKYNQEDIYYVFDGAQCHNSKLLQELILNRLNFVRTSPYSPQIMPIEKIFSKFKKQFTGSFIENQKELVKRIQVAFQQITSIDCHNCVVATFKHYQNILNQQNIY